MDDFDCNKVSPLRRYSQEYYFSWPVGDKSRGGRLK